MAIRRFISNSFANGSLTRSKFANDVFDILGIANVRVANDSFGVLEGVNTFFCDTEGSKVVIDGQGFDSTVSVLVDDSLASVVSRVSSNTLHVTLPAKTSGTYSLYVVNSDGQAVVRPDLTYINYPDWVTDYILIQAFPGSSYSNQLEATGAITYELSNTSTLPSWLTLSANGLLSSSNVDYEGISDTQFSFTIKAINSSNTAIPRTFSLPVSPTLLRITPNTSGSGQILWKQGDGALTFSTPNTYTIESFKTFNLVVDLKGAGGGPGGSAGYAGGAGGRAQGTITMAANRTYKLVVGSSVTTAGPSGPYGGGANGGGVGGAGAFGGAGGGYTGIFVTEISHANSVIIAGGGGGGPGNDVASVHGIGGQGGGTSGQAGTSASSPGQGGTQIAGGAGGGTGGAAGAAGSALRGGIGGPRATNQGSGGGGGGGFWGGGGGAAGGFGSSAQTGAGGGGGSSYLGGHSNAVTSSTSTTQGGGSAASANGSAILS